MTRSIQKCNKNNAALYNSFQCYLRWYYVVVIIIIIITSDFFLVTTRFSISTTAPSFCCVNQISKSARKGANCSSSTPFTLQTPKIVILHPVLVPILCHFYWWRRHCYQHWVCKTQCFYTDLQTLPWIQYHHFMPFFFPLFSPSLNPFHYCGFLQLCSINSQVFVL